MLPNRKIQILRDRALMLTRARQFFFERNITEVDCPIISASASIDAHIDLIPAVIDKGYRYLHSSPEYEMKRLIVEGMGNIYQLSHVFRLGEYGVKHNPEFTMAEWYLVGAPFEVMIEQTVEFIRLFLGNLPHETITYREAFQCYANIDYFKATVKDLLNHIKRMDIPFYPGIEKEGKNALLNLILGTVIEPHFGQNNVITVLTNYPATQAALAKTKMYGNEPVAERFEIYVKGMELCNGYHELADPIEQRARFEKENQARRKLGKDPLPVDENFLKALEKGMPDCCGVAVGFDRLMMLRHQASALREVVPFDWSEA